MKTSVIEVHDMLSVLAVDEVEKRIGGVPGVESATVNYAAGNATVRYDETRLEVADIKVLVHHRGQQPAGKSLPIDVSEHEPARKPDEVPTPKVAPASASKPEAAMPSMDSHGNSGSKNCGDDDVMDPNCASWSGARGGRRDGA